MEFKFPERKHKVAIIGAGRLGSRVFRNLVETHRDTLKEIAVWDGARVDGKDTYLLSIGAKIGEPKVEFLKRKFKHSEKKIKAINRHCSPDDWKTFKDYDVIVFVPAGGDTLKLLHRLVLKLRKTPFVVSNGVFGFGDETPRVWKPPFKHPEGPLSIYLGRFKTVPKNTVWVGTGKLIRDGLPATPTVMEKIAEKITAEVFRILIKKRDRKGGGYENEMGGH
jgi:predicted ThiF/HesA family dinucleotide-utilizing enzyme